jgi:predicted HicB family RNase H-like nuclease
VERLMKAIKIPETDSIEELARFWETHDITDFEDQLEEVTEPVFELGGTLQVRLRPEELKAVESAAKSKGVPQEELVHEWIVEKIQVR